MPWLFFGSTSPGERSLAAREALAERLGPPELDVPSGHPSFVSRLTRQVSHSVVWHWRLGSRSIGPGLRFVSKRTGIHFPGRLKRLLGGTWINWAYDDLLPLRRGGLLEVTLRREVQCYERYATTRRVAVLELISMGAPAAMYVPFCVTEAMTTEVGGRARPGSVVVAANPGVERAEFLEEILPQLPPGTIRLVGHWDPSVWEPLGAEVVGPVPPIEIPSFLGPGVLSIGFLRRRNRDDLNSRIYEALLTRSRLTAQPSEAIAIVAGDSASTFASAEELLTRIRAFLADRSSPPPPADLEGHWMIDRIDQILEDLD